MADLQFDTEQIFAETNGMADLAAEFLESNHAQRLRDAAYSLKRALGMGGVWQIPTENPLETLVAEREAGLLFGTLSFKWEVRRLTSKTFSVSGNASTTMVIVNEDLSAVSWNTDIGRAGHPGYRFHVQFRSNEKSIEVPRLPSILLTPVDCLDFLLGELFQEKWTRHQGNMKMETAGWTAGLRQRVTHLLRKKAECAEQSSGITPWVSLKIWDWKNPKLTLGHE